MRGAVALLLALAACGGSGAAEQLPAGGSCTPVARSVIESDACKDCARALTPASAKCSSDLDTCTNNVENYSEQHIACFRSEGSCQERVLGQASSCHRSCGDTEQSDVETCTGRCFTARAACAEEAIRRADRCLDGCAGSSCDLCTAAGRRDFGTCDQDATACANTCVRTYRCS